MRGSVASRHVGDARRAIRSSTRPGSFRLADRLGRPYEPGGVKDGSGQMQDETGLCYPWTGATLQATHLAKLAGCLPTIRCRTMFDAHEGPSRSLDQSGCLPSPSGLEGVR
jgi:hypothetical protein